MLEQEVKLAFGDYEAARAAVTSAGARLVASPRLQDDRLFDTRDGDIRARGCTLRIRREEGEAQLTFKGPVQPGPVKTREETEIGVSDAAQLETILAALGLTPWFRYQKRRETYLLDNAKVEIDQTPIGVYVEIEGPPDAIHRIAAALERTPADYVLDSYRSLYAKWCERKGIASSEMVF